MLTVNEIFYSIQGESSFAGYPCVFIRLTGCNLRCTWCDTSYAYHKGQELSIQEIIQRTLQYHSSLVEVTGGEPLLQKDTPHLVKTLLDKGLTVLVETNGSLDINILPPGCHRIIDIKTPGSSECDRNNYENLQALGNKDEIKFVITSRKDYEWSKEIMTKYKITDRCKVLLSPAYGYIEINKIAQWILQDSLKVRLQPQLHKILWPHDFKEMNKYA